VAEEEGGAEGETREEKEEYEVKTQQEDALSSKVDEKIESLVVALEVFCFKQNVPIKEFVNDVHYLSSVAERFGIPLEDLQGYVKKLESNVEEINLKKQDVLEDYGVTLELLQEYIANRPLVETNKKLRKERDSYKIKLANERAEKILREQFDKLWDEFEWSISEEELEEANMKLGYVVQGLTPEKLKKIAMDIYYRQSKHTDIIKQLMKTTQ
jgi:hypothetical protein